MQGVEISHRAETATVAGVYYFLEITGYQLDCHDSEISYLPLAHIFDRYSYFCINDCFGKQEHLDVTLPRLRHSIAFRLQWCVPNCIVLGANML